MRSNLPTEKKLNTLVKKSVDLKPLQILGWKGIKSKNTAILTLKYPSWEQKVRRPRVKKSGDKKSGKTSNLQGKLVFVQKWGRRTFSMEIGWFWGEIRVLWWRQLINTAVGHYLWGIDTSRSHLAAPQRYQMTVGHYLWGIDTLHKQEFPAGICPVNTRRTLPMRNWYRTSPTCKRTFVRLRRTLPMRNWYFLQSASLTFISFLSICRTLPMRNWYELTFLILPFLLGMSDITYEELIQSFHSCSCTFARALSRTLPMRNWYELQLLVLH